jgi:hypothetical protein
MDVPEKPQTRLKIPLTILILYSLGLLFSGLCAWLFDANFYAGEHDNSLIFWIGPLVFIAIGLAVGGLFLIAFRPINRVRFLCYAALTGLILFCITMALVQFNDSYHRRYSFNIRANEDLLNANASYPLQEKQAFKMLTDKYKNPNDFRLWQISVSRYDSIVNKVVTAAYDVEFVYFRRNRKGHYKSRCKIIGDQGSLLLKSM